MFFFPLIALEFGHWHLALWSFWTNFCVWYAMGIHFTFAQHHLLETVLSPWNSHGFYFKRCLFLVCMWGFIYKLFHWSLCLSSFQYHIVLTTASSVISFKIERWETSRFVLFHDYFNSLGSFKFHMSFRMSFSITTLAKAPKFWHITESVESTWGSSAILRILSPSNHEQDVFQLMEIFKFLSMMFYIFQYTSLTLLLLKLFLNIFILFDTISEITFNFTFRLFTASAEIQIAVTYWSCHTAISFIHFLEL